MESFTHPILFGNLVKSERKRLNMNQVVFYNYLFPNNGKEEETIKKKMNKIENGKQKSVDFDMLLAICHKCNVSADYILGIKTDYRNHENEFVCSYTGLNEKAVDQLHKWNTDKNNGADLSIIEEAFFEEQEEAVRNAYRKQTAIIFLRIINYLFKEGELPSGKTKKTREPYSNLRILHSLYLMCMAKPKTITGTSVVDEDLIKGIYDPYLKHNISEIIRDIKLDGNEPIFLEDENEVIYPISMKNIMEQIARRQLDRALDQLIASVNYEESVHKQNS